MSCLVDLLNVKSRIKRLKIGGTLWAVAVIKKLMKGRFMRTDPLNYIDKEIEIGDGLSIRSILPTSITSEDITRLVEHHFNVYRPKESFEIIKSHYSCKFLNNPAGGAIISVAQNDEGKIVGAYGGIPLRLKLGKNSEISYLICCDSVSPQFTGRNLIKRLFKRCREIISSVSPTAYAGGFTNIKARAVHKRFFSCQSVLSVHAYIIPLCFYAELSGRTNSFWRKSFLAAMNPVFSKLFYSPRLPTTSAHSSFEISRVNELPDDYSSFWNKVRNKYENIFERDADFIRWRYFIPKHIPYEFYVVRSHGRLVGYFVIKVEDRTAVVVDFIVVSGSPTLSALKPNWVKMNEGVLFRVTARRRLNSASFAVTGLPEWNLTPLRILKVMVFPSSETVQLSARSGP